MGEAIAAGVIYGICALVMIFIGVSQLKSKKPVGFYNGEKPPEPEELSDIGAWNRKHGTMWLVYGVIIAASGLCVILMGDSLFALIPAFGGILLPIGFMIAYHRRLIRKYKIK